MTRALEGALPVPHAVLELSPVLTVIRRRERKSALAVHFAVEPLARIGAATMKLDNNMLSSWRRGESRMSKQTKATDLPVPNRVAMIATLSWPR
jgi:hypothetical protein